MLFNGLYFFFVFFFLLFSKPHTYPRKSEFYQPSRANSVLHTVQRASSFLPNPLKGADVWFLSLVLLMLLHHARWECSIFVIFFLFFYVILLSRQYFNLFERQISRSHDHDAGTQNFGDRIVARLRLPGASAVLGRVYHVLLLLPAVFVLFFFCIFFGLIIFVTLVPAASNRVPADPVSLEVYCFFFSFFFLTVARTTNVTFRVRRFSHSIRCNRADGKNGGPL